MKEKSVKVIVENRKASFEYFLEERFEAGLVLVGTEIKSVREHAVNIAEAYIQVVNSEAYVHGMNISVYHHGNLFNHEPLRSRKLLLHKKEINRLAKAVKEKGYTIVPTRLYLDKGFAKLQIALAKGKKLYDKRDVAKTKSQQAEARQAIGQRKKRLSNDEY